MVNYAVDYSVVLCWEEKRRFSEEMIFVISEEIEKIELRNEQWDT
jgi:hypothetical protein